LQFPGGGCRGGPGALEGVVRKLLEYAEKLPQWFEFDPDNRLLFCGAALLLEPVPEQHL
jgi:hypothetical protein